MSILSIGSAVKFTDEVRPAVSKVSKRLNLDEAEPVRFCVLKPAAGSESMIDVEYISEETASWEELVARLPRDDCRVVVAQVAWQAHSDGVKRERQVFIQWTPSETTVKQRMMASVFSKAVKQVIEQWIGSTLRIEANGVEDLDPHDVQERIRSKSTVKCMPIPLHPLPINSC